jgi:queuosine precursor transporter
LAKSEAGIQIQNKELPLLTNELLFIIHVATVSCGALFFARLGKSALITYISLLFLAANIFVIKQIDLFNFCVTSTDAFIVGISFSCNLLQEFWDKKIARQAIWISLASCVTYMIIAKIIVAYQPAACDSTQVHFEQITENSIRIILASLVAYLITQTVDIYLYGQIKQLTHAKYFVARNYVALAVSQFVDTILFSFLGLYGIVANISDILILSFAVKLLAIALMTPFLMGARKVLKYSKQS